MTTENRVRIRDSLLVLNTTGLVAASAAGSAVLDVGAGVVSGMWVTDLSAVEVATGDELYTFVLQGTGTAAFGGTDIFNIAGFLAGDAAVLPGGTDIGVGRIIVPFHNLFQDTAYRYLRVYCTVAGTIATGVNYTSFLSI